VANLDFCNGNPDRPRTVFRTCGALPLGSGAHARSRSGEFFACARRPVQADVRAVAAASGSFVCPTLNERAHTEDFCTQGLLVVARVQLIDRDRGLVNLILPAGTGGDALHSFLLGDLRLAALSEAVPRIGHVEEHVPLFRRARSPGQHPALFSVPTVLFSLLHGSRNAGIDVWFLPANRLARHASRHSRLERGTMAVVADRARGLRKTARSRP
jgi:hypothetical protein